MIDNRKVAPIVYCQCCGARRRVLGVYEPGAGWYCVRCEMAIKRANQVEPTPESAAFVKRLAARGASA